MLASHDFEGGLCFLKCYSKLIIGFSVLTLLPLCYYMFRIVTSLNRGLLGWSVSAKTFEPENFDAKSVLTASNEPVCGTCPIN